MSLLLVSVLYFSEEWEWLKRINTRHKSLENLQGKGRDGKEVEELLRGTEQQVVFVEQVASSVRRLFSFMDIRLDEAMSHR